MFIIQVVGFTLEAGVCPLTYARPESSSYSAVYYTGLCQEFGNRELLRKSLAVSYWVTHIEGTVSELLQSETLQVHR